MPNNEQIDFAAEKWVTKRGASLDFYAFPDEIYDVFAGVKLFRETNCYFCYVEARSRIRL